MSRTGQIGLLLLAIAGALAIALWAMGALEPAIDAPAAPGTVSAHPPAVDRTATDAASQHPTRRGATGQVDGSRPIPSRSEWREVLVVNPDGEPQPDVDLYWFCASDQRGLHESMPNGQPIRAAIERGWRTRTDAEGVARIAVENSACVAASRDGWFGQLVIEDVDTERHRHRLILFPDVTLRARVLDQQNRPIAGVPVTVSIADDAGRPLDGPSPRGSSDANGLAEIRHFHLWRSSLTELPEMDGRRIASIRLALPGATSSAVEFAIDAPPAEPVTLHVPTLGRIHVHTEHGDHVSLTSGSSHASAPVDENGWARFAHVPIGMRFRALSSGEYFAGRSFDGPTTAGETIEVRLDGEVDRVILSGRLVDEAGAPISQAPIQMLLRGSGCLPVRIFRTDPNGRFFVAISPTRTTETAHASCQMKPLEEFQDRGVAFVPRASYATGIHDLGEQVLRRPAKQLVAGRLFLDSRPWSGPSPLLVVQRDNDPGERGQASWSPFPYLVVPDCHDGRFVLWSDCASNSLAITTFRDDLMPIEPLAFDPGETEIEVHLQSCCCLIVTALIPASIFTHRIRCRVVPTDAPNLPEARQDAYEGRIERIHGEHCSVRFDDLPAGVYSIEFSLVGSGDALTVVDNVHVPLPATGDPRLDDIRVDGIRTVTVRLFDQNGEPVSSNGIVLTSLPGSDGDVQGYSLYGAASRLALPASQAQFVALVRDHRPAHFAVAGPVLDLRLERWPTVRLQLPKHVELPADVTMVGELVPVRPLQGMWFADGDEGELSELLRPRRNSGRFHRGALNLPVGAGRHRVELSLVGKNGRRVRIEGVALPEVLSTQSQIPLELPGEALQRALDRITR